MSEVGTQPFSNNVSPPVPLTPPSVNYAAFIDFLSKILCNLLDSGEQKSELLKTLHSQACIECVQKFMTDAQTPVIVAQKYSNKEGDEDNDDDYQYGLTTDVHYSGPKVYSVAFVKRTQVIETDKKFFNQLHIFSLEDSSPYETLRTFIGNICAPYFKSYVKEAGIIDKDGDKMAPTLEKKIAEVEMGLLHLQQNIDIPEVNLVINPFVQQVINDCAEENRKPKVDDFQDKLEDSDFLNQLQAGVNRWIREIQKVTKLDRDPSSGTALQEVSFWLNLERALNRIQEKRESLEVTLTLEILKTGKRFHATVSFDSDTGLKQALDQVRNYNVMMKDFPINDLLSATDIEKIRLAVQIIFGNLKKIRNTRYPATRGLRFVEAISRDLTNQMLKILVTRKLMHITFDEFEKTMKECFDVFAIWDEEYDKFQALLRDLTKKKRDEHYRMVWRISPMHKILQFRLDQVRRFRRQHDQLRNVIVRVLRPIPGDRSTSSAKEMSFDVSDANAIDEVNSAYENIKEVDVLDLSKEGADVWEAATRRYDERIDRVENKITAKLRDQLGTAKNANEMFRIFSRFNALFIRPHIRGAISEYQTQLIQRVKTDIETLHTKFTAQYAHSSSSRLSHARDIPPISGSIIWAKQIERQLSTYLRRVEDVIGKGWENHVEGAKLKADGDAFKQKLNTQELFDDWTRKVQQRNLGISGKIFAVEIVKTLKGPVFRLCVNFSPEIITLYKEVRNMRPLNFRVPLVIVNKAHHVNQLYPFAISLDEAVRSYENTIAKVSENEKIAMLISSMKKEIQGLISEGVDLNWESYKLETYVYKFAETVYSFQEKVDELLGIEQMVQNELKALEVCAYDHGTFTEILSKIQKCVDNLSLKSYSNVSQWVNYIDKEVEKKLASRLHSSVIAWNKALMRTMADHTDVIADDDDYISADEPKIKELIHEIRITNQVLCVNPPIEEARHCLLLELFQHESVVLALQRIHSGRYTLTVEVDSDYRKTYKSLLKILPDSTKILKDTYCIIDKIIDDASKYIKTWLDFQSLWDLQPDLLYERLGKDVGVWMKCVNEIRDARKTFDTQESSIKFGPVTIDYNKVQSKVNFKYDAWHKDVLTKFGALLGTEMQDFHRQISKARSELESHSVDASSTSEAVNVITYVQQLKRQLNQWEKQVNTYAHGQKILERQRYQFPVQWLDVENIKGEWSAFNDILKRKNASIQNQVSVLQKKIQTENEVIETRTQDVLKDWETDKPVVGNIHPNQACKILNEFEIKLNRVKQDRDNIIKAKEALEIEDFDQSNTKDRFKVAIEELQDLKEVWDELSIIWKKIDDLREIPWVSVQPRKLRANLDDVMNELKKKSARTRQYASYQYVKNLIQSYTKVNILIIELKSEAVKERHWRTLMKQLSVSWSLSDLTLGQVWDVDLLKYETKIKDIMLVAQGEKALEEFLKQVSETWKTYSLDLINYQNRCRIIRGWDELLDKIKEHINSLGAMKLSPYYKEFTEEALSWEDKLNRLNSLFDMWIDVQRRWVYLDGIFGATADVKLLLPVETQKFNSVSSDFLGLMKKVSRSPLVLDVLYIQGIHKTLERLLELLNKIQKALGEYLEKERASFPRFYFVGDEDLLEIIGNAKNIPKLQKHFKKMFAGVHALILNDDGSQILGISSKEGEEVHFLAPISIADHPKINDWLSIVEKEMRNTLASSLAECVREIIDLRKKEIYPEAYINWIDKYQAQLVVLGAQVAWSESVEQALSQGGEGLDDVLEIVTRTLQLLADSVLEPQSPVRRKKLEHLIIEHVHQRDVIRSLLASNVKSTQNFSWLSHMRFYFDPKNPDPLTKLSIKMANAEFKYGFEYLGVQEKLVQTPLTDRCYLTMTQALEARLGGSPFGPAGTGKTESVKALGNQLGRFVLVFNCDETFDFQAMGRIFVGLCQVGAWGCFDEFNRLEERMLSAVSQQIQIIQEALREMTGKQGKEKHIELVGKQVSLHPNMAIFITMNPGYAGRSNLPDNLKKLFRSLAMTQPDLVLIAQVMLFSQGFRNAELLAHKVVPFFRLCNEQLSNQSHYDFGLRSLKNVLVMAGNIKREKLKEASNDSTADDDAEQMMLIQSIMQSFSPRLISEDLLLLRSLVNDVFPGTIPSAVDMTTLKSEILKVCTELNLEASANNAEMGALWLEKILQLYEITNLNHGLMMVGPSGSGKTTAWRVLLTALNRIEKSDGVAHVIDPKAISKDALYGTLDPNTREWNDGLFTHVLRKIIDNVRGELSKRQWIIFDGDVDPEWVENLNSVLDDNKLLTLPNGERLPIPPNVRIMFEVQDLKYATLATVSRCGMIWFSAELVTSSMLFANFLSNLRKTPIDPISSLSENTDLSNDPNMSVQKTAANILEPFFANEGLVKSCLEYAENQEHIMAFTKNRAISSLFSMLMQAIKQVIQYNITHPDFPMSENQLENFITRFLAHSILWSFTGDCKLRSKHAIGDFMKTQFAIPLPEDGFLIDFEANIDGQYSPWSIRVPHIEVETHRVGATDVVIPTVDTVRHESLVYGCLAEHRPLILCGPPGCGKTMTLFSSLRSLPEFEVVGLNFSSATSPELLIKTFDQYCEYRRTPNGTILSPIQLNKWLIIFCDEINLPDEDKYGTQRVISFLRQILEHGGFYRSSDQTFIKLERIQFVGACNPPTDPGRKPLSLRFLRHVSVLYVDYSGEISLKQIYGTFNRAMLRVTPYLQKYAEALTNAMVEFFLVTQEHFTVDMQPHYIYSPRELTRWVRGIREAITPLDNLTIEGLVRLWAHEAFRLFQDRLVYDEERKWTKDMIHEVAAKHFSDADLRVALQEPILYSNWLTKDYLPVNQDELRIYVKARLKVFYEEELDVPLVLFDDVLDHVLRIDRVFRQPQGHLLLIGVSGAGKTTLCRFVAWINGLSIVQIKVHNKYTMANFDDDLRNILRRCGCKGEKIAFLLDEGNLLQASFLERMNTLLANGEVPGLFEGDEYVTLINQCKEGAQRDGLMLDSHDELYRWFINEITRNLHVVFTMNPSSEGLKDKASTSPALFNRCVLNWFGDWTDLALFQVAVELTSKIDLEWTEYTPPPFLPKAFADLPEPPTHREALTDAFVYVHQTLQLARKKIQHSGGNIISITPRNFLDFIAHFVKLYNEKRSEIEEHQLHLRNGLKKISETLGQVEELQESLALKRNELETKNKAASAKLQEMVMDQQEAEKQKVASEELKVHLAQQTEEIAKKTEEVKKDLERVEPAVLEAKQAVQGIKKQHLIELRSLREPPAPVKLALESICLLLGQETSDWKNIRAFVVSDGFINTIVNFKTESVSNAVREKMKTKYLSNQDYTFEKVNKGSQACGPLYKWAVAQLEYSEMLNKVGPLRNELSQLETEASNNRTRATELDNLIATLETNITRYKEEYAELIRQAQLINSDLKTVEAKVTRSVSLLKSLNQEQSRWEETSQTFYQQMSTIVGDVFLSAAFLAYAGYFDQLARQNFWNMWTGHLLRKGIRFREDLAKTEYMSTADERLKWQANSLPSDELCIENAIMLQRFVRYPLIIDPSGQAIDFLLKEYKDKSITITSFLDDSFRKQLESALRFGNPLIVQDVESFDPILNPVLNKELRRTSGRVLISIGDQDIDFSPAFAIYLSTRDPTMKFSPNLCSKVTFVNFTVTRMSLQSQCLNTVLKVERPDVDAKRSDLIKLQGEFQQKLRKLEKGLLQALNDVQGRILDDDSIISKLETLKKEAAEVSAKAKETDNVMAEVERTSQKYLPLSQACSSIFFAMQSLSQFFLEVFTSVLNDNPHLCGIQEPEQRLEIITNDLFKTSYKRVARGLLHNDCIVFSLLLAKLFLETKLNQDNFENEFKFMMQDLQMVLPQATQALHIDGFSAKQIEGLQRLERTLPQFSGIFNRIQDNLSMVKAWLENVYPETIILHLAAVSDGEQKNSALRESIHNLLLIQILRPDRFVAAARKLFEVVFNSEITVDDSVPNLSEIIDKEIKSYTPLLLCSVTGYDASGKIEELSAQTNTQIASIAIGSSEGFELADAAINRAARNGKWVLLKNVHLAPSWLTHLEKKIHSLKPNENFRLFLSMEINDKVPPSLLRLGRILVYEPAPGIKANLKRIFESLSSQRLERAPKERSHLYFLLAWLHSILLERLRYKPLGWSKFYDFNEADLKCAIDTIDYWVDCVAMGRTNLPPEKVPWDALKCLMAKCIYGGRIDNEFDYKLVSIFVERYFTPESFSPDFKLFINDETQLTDLLIPDAIEKEQFLKWIDDIKLSQSPTWIGLPSDAEKVLLANLCTEISSKLLRLSSAGMEETAYEPDTDEQNICLDKKPSWMKRLGESAASWFRLIPNALYPLERTSSNIQDPIFRFFDRELKTGSYLLNKVRDDVQQIIDLCEGKIKQTNYIRVLITDLTKGIVPKSWSLYSVPNDITITQWILDFAQRIEQLRNVASIVTQNGIKGLHKIKLWLGGLFTPQGYLTATRQLISQKKMWSLEKLEMKVSVFCDDVEMNECSFAITGLQIEGAMCANNNLEVSLASKHEMPVIVFQWIQQESNVKDDKIIKIPVYLNRERSDVLFTLDFPTKHTRLNDFYERGVAVLLSKL